MFIEYNNSKEGFEELNNGPLKINTSIDTIYDPFYVNIYDELSGEYGKHKFEISHIIDKTNLNADSKVLDNPEKYYDKLITIDLSVLEPHINGPFSPDIATPISKMKEVAKKNNWPTKIDVGLIGSCTNSSYEDISRASSIAFIEVFVSSWTSSSQSF